MKNEPANFFSQKKESENPFFFSEKNESINKMKGRNKIQLLDMKKQSIENASKKKSPVKTTSFFWRIKQQMKEKKPSKVIIPEGDLEKYIRENRDDDDENIRNFSITDHLVFKKKRKKSSLFEVGERMRESFYNTMKANNFSENIKVFQEKMIEKENRLSKIEQKMNQDLIEFEQYMEKSKKETNQQIRIAQTESVEKNAIVEKLGRISDIKTIRQNTNAILFERIMHLLDYKTLWQQIQNYQENSEHQVVLRDSTIFDKKVLISSLKKESTNFRVRNRTYSKGNNQDRNFLLCSKKQSLCKNLSNVNNNDKSENISYFQKKSHLISEKKEPLSENANELCRRFNSKKDENNPESTKNQLFQTIKEKEKHSIYNNLAQSSFRPSTNHESAQQQPNSVINFSNEQKELLTEKTDNFKLIEDLIVQFKIVVSEQQEKLIKKEFNNNELKTNDFCLGEFSEKVIKKVIRSLEKSNIELINKTEKIELKLENLQEKYNSSKISKIQEQKRLEEKLQFLKSSVNNQLNNLRRNEISYESNFKENKDFIEKINEGLSDLMKMLPFESNNGNSLVFFKNLEEFFFKNIRQISRIPKKDLLFYYSLIDHGKKRKDSVTDANETTKLGFSTTGKSFNFLTKKPQRSNFHRTFLKNKMFIPQKHKNDYSVQQTPALTTFTEFDFK